jgi:hypothetical protein
LPFVSLPVFARPALAGPALLLVLWCGVAHAEPDGPVPAEPSGEAPEQDALPAAPRWGVPVVHSLSVFTGTRLVEAALYPDPFAETDLAVIGRHYRDAFTRPPLFDSDEAAFEWDGDPWPINVFGHGLLGSELYYRPRRCGFSVGPALAFAAGGTLVWAAR